MRAPGTGRSRRMRAAGMLLVGLTLAGTGCYGTSWQARGRTPRIARTTLVVTSTPPAMISVDGQSFGSTPAEIPVSYGALAERSVRDVTLWKSNPKLATALTILSGGGYLPSSLFPISTEVKTEDTGFQDNVFVIRLERDGYAPWSTSVELRGEREQSLDAELEPVGGSDGG